MRALLLGRPGHERTRLEEILSAADSVVEVCHQRSWGCVGMDHACPLDSGAVDVAVAVADPGDRFDPQGIACAFRARIPIVAIGATPGDPVLDYVTDTVARVDSSVIDVLLNAARDASGHREAAERALDALLGPEEHADVSVRRLATSVHVAVVGDFAPHRRAAVADAARAAVRAHDTHVATIDVTVTAPTTPG